MSFSSIGEDQAGFLFEELTSLSSPRSALPFPEYCSHLGGRPPSLMTPWKKGFLFYKGGGEGKSFPLPCRGRVTHQSKGRPFGPRLKKEIWLYFEKKEENDLYRNGYDSAKDFFSP